MAITESVTKIVSTSQNQSIQRVKTLTKLLSVELLSILGLLHLTLVKSRGALTYAQLIQQQEGQTQTITDPWYRSLEIAQSKVQAALSLGAFGHGVPRLHHLTPADILVAFRMSVSIGICIYRAIRTLLKHTNKGKMCRMLLLNKITMDVGTFIYKLLFKCDYLWGQ